MNLCGLSSEQAPYRPSPTHSYLRFILPSIQRFFIARESRLLPAGVSSPRLRFFPFVELPLGLPMRFLPAREEADPKSAAMARLSRSSSCFKSETTFVRSKERLSFCAVGIGPLRSRRRNLLVKRLAG
jgi:hypothetical protein